MSEAYQNLEIHFHRLTHIEHALTFLQWDQLVMMPSGGNTARADTLAELSALHHEMITREEVSELLFQAAEENLEAEKKTSLAEMHREWKRAACLPSDLVKAKSLAGSKCEYAWRGQRAENDWNGFLGNFREVVNLSRQEAMARQAADSEEFSTPYDALLDLYCTGDSSEMIEDIFVILKKTLPSLLQEVVEKQRGRQLEIPGYFPIKPQKKLNRELLTILGFDFDQGRLDESTHPFSTGDSGDHRITTRFRTDDFLDALKATAHECGHASYERGLPEQWRGLPVGQARNLSIHESQSLLFEKQIVLSKPFISFLTPKIHTYLQDSASFDSNRIWQVFTRVQPSFIRVEADEVSYPLHVILRFEIERDLINSNIEPDDLPEAWDEKMQRYLGVSTAGNFRNGCLQDIHWTDGSFGYFPAYTLGSLNGVQLFDALCAEYPDWQESFTKGELLFLGTWLKENIWSKGSTLSSQQLIQSATGEGTNPEHFLAYIRNRYLQELY